MESYQGNRVVGLFARCLVGMSILALVARESQLKEGKISGGMATEKDTGEIQVTGRISVGRVVMSAFRGPQVKRPKRIRGKRGRPIGMAANRLWDSILIARRMRPKRGRGISAKKGERGIASPKEWRKRLPAGSRPGLRGLRRDVFRKRWDLILPRLGGSRRGR